MTIQEIIAQDKAILFHALKEYGGIEEVVKSGREKRNERRRKDRAQAKLKNK